MSEEKFKQAKANLAFSQSLRSQAGGQDMAPQQPMSPNAPQAPQEETSPQPSVEEAVQSAMQPFMKQIEDMIAKKLEMPQEATLKVQGTMEPNK